MQCCQIPTVLAHNIDFRFLIASSAWWFGIMTVRNAAQTSGKKNQAQVLKDVKTLERVQRRLIRIALGMGDFSVGE